MKSNRDAVEADIQDWPKERIHEFACQESAYVGEDVEIFKDRHLFKCLYEIFWVEFSVNLHKSLERLIEKHWCWIL